MNEFTASNGRTIEVGEDRYVIRDQHNLNALARFDYLDGDDMHALREFFRAEADERLGRWRWPENPDYVVYAKPDDDGGSHRMIRESDGEGWYVHRGWVYNYDLGGDTKLHHQAARAFFDAHPEPKPWHEANIGDVWVMEPLSIAYTVVGGYEKWFTRGDVFGKVELRELTDPVFTAGRRIWPEEVAS